MFKRILPTAFAIFSGLLVLGGLLFPQYPQLAMARMILLRSAMVVAAFAFILAFANLLRVHLYRLGRHGKRRFTSFLVLLSALVVAPIVFIEGPTGLWSRRVMEGLLVPGEGALLALTAITLILAALRMLRVRRGAGTFLFLFVLLVLLVGTASEVPFVGEVATWLREVPAMAGMRGLVLGVALGIALTALRVILGLSQPHSD
jgi:hypothetical protein